MNSAGAVLVDGRTIVAAGAAADVGIPTGASVRQLRGYTLLPGLIDVHVHFFGVDGRDLNGWLLEDERDRVLRAARDAETILFSGFTTVRCLGSSVGPALARAIAGGIARGPRIVPAGQFICALNGTWDRPRLASTIVRKVDMAVSGPEECRAIVRRRLRDGAGVIKVGLSSGLREHHFRSWGDSPDRQQVQLSEAELRAVVEEAHVAGVKVSCHAIGDDAVTLAVRCGVDVVEHGHGVSDKTRELLAGSRTVVVPTLTHMRLLGERGPQHGLGDAVREVAESHRKVQESDLLKLHTFGIEFACGSDIVGSDWSPHGESWREIQYMVEAGVPVAAALQAATTKAARVVGLEAEVGLLEAGMRADIVAVKGDPFRNPGALASVDLVVQGGDIVKDVVVSG
jgi:imidazolonepropionase-like amidohydrolase